MIQELGGYIIKVIRPNTLKDSHISENELDCRDAEDFNNIILNDGTKEELFDKIVEIIN